MDFLAFILAVIALVWGYRRGIRIDDLEEKFQKLQNELERLEQKLRMAVRDPAHRHEAEPESVASPLSATVEKPRPEDLRARWGQTPAAPPLVPPPIRPPVMPSAPAFVSSSEAREKPSAAPPLPPPASPPRPPAPPTKPPSPPPQPPQSPAASFDWEALIGVKLFSWIAAIALVFAAIFTFKISIERGWLGPPIRMAIGLLVGAGLLFGCEWKAARRYPVTANALDAAGIAILFSTFFAAHTLWNLIPGPLPTFLCMAGVTAVAVLLSIRHDSLFIALLGLVGGFATPALLSTGEDRPIGLFSYLLLLNAGLAWVAFRKRWPYLTVLSAIFTAVYQWGWVLKFLHTGNLPLALGIFLVFPILSFAALALGQSKDPKNAEDPLNVLFRETTSVSVALPLLFAIFMAATHGYGERYGLLFGFLFLIDVGLGAIAAKRGPEYLHLVGAIGTLVTLSVWLAQSYSPEAWPAVLGIVSVFVLLYLVVGYLGFLRIGFEDLGLRAVYAAPLLLVAFPVLAAIEPAAAAPAALFTVLFVLVAIIAVYAIAREDGPAHYIAAFFALAAEAVWSARHLDPDRLLAGLAIYALFGLFYLGIPLVAGRLNKRLEPEGSGALVLFASLGLLFFLAAGPVAASALWGIAILLAILNFGLFMSAASGRHPLLLLAGLALSWIVIAVWWATVSLAALLIPGLIAVAGFAIMILGGNIWASRRFATEPAGTQEGGQAPRFNEGLYLGLIGHAFLFFVAVRPELSLPPWPMLAVLAVLDLAIGVAALYTRRGELHLGAAAASQFIVIAWLYSVGASATTIAIYCGLAVAIFGFVWFLLAEKICARTPNLDSDDFGTSALATALLGMAIVALGARPEAPGIGLFIGATVLLGGLVLAVDWRTAWQFLSPVAVVASALAVGVWSYFNFTSEHWSDEFFFAAAVYALFLAYPLLLGSRAQQLLEPYLAAVLASVSFFFFARHSLMAAGFGDRIGILPVTQGALMGVLVWRLTRLEPPGQRTLGRLAMVAGSVLAFVTVAIPLQLEKQWITIGWALLAAALSWLWQKIPHHGLLLWTGGLLAAVFVRLVNPAIFAYHPRGGTPILNWYLYTYLVSAAAFFLTAWLLRRMESTNIPRLTPLATGGGAVLLFLLMNIEIADFYSEGPAITFNLNAGLAQDLTYTIGWGIFSFALLIAGIALRSKAARGAAVGLLSVTVAKCFLHDLWNLGGLYRVGSLVGLAICLTLMAVLLQKFVLRPHNESA